ncbi:MAG: hypothetical protein IKM98_12405, partial [Bacteroidales bacterium]|nr:hypothetical protein [Bacteroidales bacterium]
MIVVGEREKHAFVVEKHSLSLAVVEAVLLDGEGSGFGAGSYGDNTRFNYASRSMSPVIIIDGVERNLVAID